jgi:hypothetical protein
MEFESVKTVAETKGAAYPLTKKWFLSTYPKFKENNVSEEEWKTIFSQSVEANKNKAVEDATAESDKVEQFPALATAKASNF